MSIPKKIFRLILAVILAVLFFQFRWYIRQPEYDSVDMQPNRVLELSEAVFRYQIEHGFNGKPITSRSFYLKILNGYPDYSFYKNIRQHSSQRVERAWLKSTAQHERDASLSIDSISDNNGSIVVTATINWCFDRIEDIGYRVTQRNSTWMVTQLDYPKERLESLITARNARPQNKHRCQSILYQ